VRNNARIARESKTPAFVEKNIPFVSGGHLPTKSQPEFYEPEDESVAGESLPWKTSKEKREEREEATGTGLDLVEDEDEPAGEILCTSDSRTITEGPSADGEKVELLDEGRPVFCCDNYPTCKHVLNAPNPVMVDEGITTNYIKENPKAQLWHRIFSRTLNFVCGPHAMYHMPNGQIGLQQYADDEVDPEQVRNAKKIGVNPVSGWYEKNADAVCGWFDIITGYAALAAVAYVSYKVTKKFISPVEVVIPQKEMTEVIKEFVQPTIFESKTFRNEAMKMLFKTPKFNFNVYDYDSNNVVLNGAEEIPLGSDHFIKWMTDVLEVTKAGKATITIKKKDGTITGCDVVKFENHTRPKRQNRVKRDLLQRKIKNSYPLKKESAPLYCKYCTECHSHHDGCRVKLESLRASQKAFCAKFTPESLLTVQQRLNMGKFHDRTFKMFVNVCSQISFVCNGFLYGEKLITTKHGFTNLDGSKKGTTMAQSSLSTTYPGEFVDIVDGKEDLIFFPMKGHNNPAEKVQLKPPVDGEAVFLVAYDKPEQRIPSITSGVINAQGYHTCNSISGNCGGAMVNMDGFVVGFHQAGSTSVNKCIPVTDAMIKSLQSGF